MTFSSLFTFDMDGGSFVKIPHLDKLVHFTFYFVMVVLGVLAAGEYLKKRIKFSNVLIYTLLFAIAYGIIIEVIQYTLTVNRQGDVLDALANTLGALLGMFIARIFFSKKWSLK